ncbi:hypothetical protein [Fructobacillus ficulneus]|nr:hypothetical protein [Fructobacillus ficulneus]
MYAKHNAVVSQPIKDQRQSSGEHSHNYQVGNINYDFILIDDKQVKKIVDSAMEDIHITIEKLLFEHLGPESQEYREGMDKCSRQWDKTERISNADLDVHRLCPIKCIHINIELKLQTVNHRKSIGRRSAHY